MPQQTISYQVTTLFLSDIHLGCKDCKAEYLLNFLNTVDCKQVFLLGDIIDLHALKRQSYWPKTHQAILKKLHTMHQSGIKITYIPGNHDDALRDFIDTRLFGFNLASETVYTSASGKHLLLLHGDLFDGPVLSSRFIGYIGDKGYDLLLFINRWSYQFRKRLGLSYFSIAGHIKKRIKKANITINNYEKVATDEALRRKLDGIVCGHIHLPMIKCHNNTLYMNCGDWIENCTAIVEHRDGSFELLHYSEKQQQLAIHSSNQQAA